MDEQQKRSARQKRVVDGGKGVEKKGEGLGTGPVNNMGNYADRKEQQAQRPQAAVQNPSAQSVKRPQQNFSQNAQKTGQNPFSQSTQRPAQNPFSQSAQRPAQNPFTQNSQKAGQSPFSQSTKRPAQNAFGQSQQQRPASRPAQSSRPASSGGSSSQNGSGASRGTGGSGKIILLLIAVAAIFFFGKNALFGGGDQNSNSGTSLPIQSTQNQSQTQTAQNDISGQGSGLTNLLSSFLGSAGSSSYDFSGILNGLTGGSGATATSSGNSSSSQYFTTSMENNTMDLDQSVSSKAREKYTVIKGGKKDKITILMYMCGADLESQNGMATSDLKEMVNATLSDNINLIVFTGGCRKWRNNVISTNNQIYQIKDGSLVRLEENMGNASMTNPNTLAEFIRYGAKNYPANRMCLIFWDHGGGSVSGYGYDERYGQGQTMTLAGINEALKNGGVQFDFIGFDTCLMATVENGLMLDQYADYMIASEETEPGVGWYYTNWLTKLSSKPSMPTIEIGKIITDDFVEVCNRNCRGQATTLSVVDLAELAATVPDELKKFSISTNELIQNKEYKKVSSARSSTREFAQQTRIDQIDLVHFARNMKTEEGTSLAKALQGAIKYNRTGGGISNAYGLSIYFPYKKAGKVKQAVSTYKAIGMDDEYTRCIQEFASLEISGQVSAGTSIQDYGNHSTAMPGLMESLLGGNGTSSGIGNSYSSDSLESLLGGLFGGSSSSSGNTGSILDLFMGRSMTAEKASEYILENHFDPSALVWKKNRITLTDEQWTNVESVMRNVFYDDGKGFIDLGTDYEYRREGNDLVYEFDGTWISIDRQPVAYYNLGTIEQGDCYAEVGYVPVLLNGVRANLILVFDQDNPYGYIAGAQQVYAEGDEGTLPKNMTGIGKGDRIQAICDYFDYQQNYQNSYRLGDEFVLGSEVEIANTVIDQDKCKVTWCLTDYYQQRYWTPAKK